MTSDQLLDQMAQAVGARTMAELSRITGLGQATLSQVRNRKGLFGPATAVKLLKRFPEFADAVLGCTQRNHSDCQPTACPWYSRCQALQRDNEPVECEVTG